MKLSSLLMDEEQNELWGEDPKEEDSTREKESHSGNTTAEMRGNDSKTHHDDADLDWTHYLEQVNGDVGAICRMFLDLNVGGEDPIESIHKDGRIINWTYAEKLQMVNGCEST